MLHSADPTTKQDIEQELKQTAERLEILLKIESGILRAVSPTAIADLALEQLEKIIPCMASTINLFESSYSEVVTLASRNARLKSGDTMLAVADQVKARKRGEPLLINDIAALPELTIGLESVLQWGGRSLLSTSMLSQGELIGTLTLIDAKPNVFSEPDIQITQQIGNSIAIAIHNARLLEKEKKTRREAETLREVAAQMTASLDRDKLLAQILTQLKLVLQYDSASVLLFEEGKLKPVAQQGIELAREEFTKQFSKLPPNIVRLSENLQPHIIPDTLADPEWVIYPGTEFIRSWLGVPLMVKEEFIGLLMVDNSEPNFYDEYDASVALAFAYHAATAIENANLYGEIQQYSEILETRVAERTRELRALLEITAIMSQHLELSEMLDKIVAVISDALEIDIVSIQVVDKSGSTIRLAAYNNLEPPMIEFLQEQPVTNSITEAILNRREATIYTNPGLDSELAEMPVSNYSSFGVALPIRATNRDLGILAIAYYRSEKPRREDIALLSSIADHIGVAIENARLREQSEHIAVLEERERLARELHDSATQSLFSLTLFAAAAREHLSSGQLDLVQHQLVDLEETANQTHNEMRLLLYDLRSTVLENEGLVKALQQRIRMVEFRSGIQGHVTADLTTELPTAVEEVLFQVANEALNNVLKHSGADMVRINISANNSYATMKIEDNGQGIAKDDADFSPGMGLDIMRRRVLEMNGSFQYESDPASGTIIVVQIPLLESEEATVDD